MCDGKDLGVHSEDDSPLGNGSPVVIIYDSVPGGIGLSKKLYEINETLIHEAYILVKNCPCQDGCPACTGPVAENGLGAKEHATAILYELLNPEKSSANIIDFPR
jgi:DEAD/DEAH box helicase domain-containing protein